MSWSAHIASPFGIPLRVHASFVIVLAFGALQWSSHGLSGALFGALASLLLFACVLLHELGHSLTARAFGIHTRQILLMPLGGIAELEGKPKRPLHDLVISLAGPAVNVTIAVVLFVALGASPDPGAMAAPSLATLGLVLLMGNIGLAGFNLLPFYPLDGGRALRALLAHRLGEDRSLRVAAGIGQVGAVALGLWAVFSGHVLLAAIAVLLFAGAGSARAQGQLPELLRGLRAGEVCEQGQVVLTPNTSIAAALRSTMVSAQTVFPVVLGDQVLGLIPRGRIVHAAASDGYVTSLMDRRWLEVDASEPVADVLARLGSDEVVAVRSEGHLFGFLSVEHVLRNVVPAAAARPHPSVPSPRAARDVSA